MNRTTVHHLRFCYSLLASSRVSTGDACETWHWSKNSKTGVRSHDSHQSVESEEDTYAWSHYVMQSAVCKHAGIISVLGCINNFQGKWQNVWFSGRFGWLLSIACLSHFSNLWVIIQQNGNEGKADSNWSRNLFLCISLHFGTEWYETNENTCILVNVSSFSSLRNFDWRIENSS